MPPEASHAVEQAQKAGKTLQMPAKPANSPGGSTDAGYK